MATDVEKLLVRVEANLKQYEREMARARGVGVKAMRDLERDTTSAVSRIERAWSKAGTTVKAGFGGFIAGLGAEQLARAAASAIKSIADIGDQATKLGISNSQFQDLKLSAQLAGVEVSALAGGMKKLGVNSSDAVRGQGEFGAILKANNISLLDHNGNLRSQVEILGIVANLVANAASEQDGLAIAQAALGKSGTELMGLLEQGAAGVEAAMRQASESGVKFTDAQIAKAQEYDDQIDLLIEKIGFGLKSAFVDYAIPAGEAFYNSSVRDVNNLIALWNNLGLTIAATSANPRGFAPPALSGPVVRDDRAPSSAIPLTPAAGGKVDLPTRRSATTVLPPDPSIAAEAAKRASESVADAKRKAASEERANIQRLRELERDRAAEARGYERVKLDVARDYYDFEFDAAQKASDAFIERQEQLRDGLAQLGEMGFAALESVAFGGEKASTAVLKLASSLADAALQALVLGKGPLSGLFGTSGGGLLGSLIGGLSGGLGGGVSAGFYHSGGVVGSGGMKKSVSPSVFANAPRYHGGGIAGLKSNEVPAILERGEIIIPKGGKAGGETNYTINVNVAGAHGDREIMAMVEAGVSAGISKSIQGEASRSLERNLRG